MTLLPNMALGFFQMQIPVKQGHIGSFQMLKYYLKFHQKIIKKLRLIYYVTTPLHGTFLLQGRFTWLSSCNFCKNGLEG
jgi:hypothetical protein